MKNHTMLLRAKTLGAKGDRQMLDAAKHNLREISGDHIDAARTARNKVLAGPETARAVAALAKGRREELGVMLERKNSTRGAEVIFGLPVSTPVDTGQYFRACLEWLQLTFGADALLSAVIHYDEAAPHMHALMLPMKAGAWLGSKVFGGRADMQHLQKDFAMRVGASFGLRQAPTKLASADRHAAAAEVLGRLRDGGDAALHSAVWPVIRDAIEADPRVYAEQLGIEVKRRLPTLGQLKVRAGRGPRRERETPIDDQPASAGNIYPVLGVCSATGTSHNAETGGACAGASGSGSASGDSPSGRSFASSTGAWMTAWGAVGGAVGASAGRVGASGGRPGDVGGGLSAVSPAAENAPTPADLLADAAQVNASVNSESGGAEHQVAAASAPKVRRTGSQPNAIRSAAASQTAFRCPDDGGPSETPGAPAETEESAAALDSASIDAKPAVTRQVSSEVSTESSAVATSVATEKLVSVAGDQSRRAPHAAGATGFTADVINMAAVTAPPTAVAGTIAIPGCDAIGEPLERFRGTLGLWTPCVCGAPPS